MNNQKWPVSTFSPTMVRRGAEVALLTVTAILASACAVESPGAEKPESLGEAQQASVTCTTLQRGTFGSVQDALIAVDTANPTPANTNFGASASLTTGASGTATRQGLVQWDMTAIQGPYTVSGATATLYVNLYGGVPVDAHQVTAAWQESSVTYNSFGEAFLPAVAATFPATPYISINPNGSISSLPEATSTDLTAIATGWADGTVANDGIILERAPGASTVFGSSESTVVAYRPALQVCYACTSPVGWWKGEDNLLDSSGNNNNGLSGVLNGATPVGFAPGEVGSAFALNGTSYVDVPNEPDLEITGPITMDAWIFANAPGGRIIEKITAGGSDGYLLDTSPDRLRIIIGDTALEADVPLPTGVWVHAAGTWDGATARLYMNGALVGSTAAGPLPSTAQDLRVGGDSNGQNRFDGLIDEAALYNVALPQPQIQAIFAAGAQGRCF
jgi:hypothetical protein